MGLSLRTCRVAGLVSSHFMRSVRAGVLRRRLSEELAWREGKSFSPSEKEGRKEGGKRDNFVERKKKWRHLRELRCVEGRKETEEKSHLGSVVARRDCCCLAADVFFADYERADLRRMPCWR